MFITFAEDFSLKSTESNETLFVCPFFLGLGGR